MKHMGFVWAGLFVQDMETSVSFYRDVLDLPLLGRGDGWAHLDAGNGALLELISGGQASREPKRADQQPMVLGLRVKDLDGAIAELKRKGVNFIGEIGKHEDTRWAHFSDPEGNRLEIKEVPPHRLK
jgi:predicted enzyme related to lactoylglutathione lyase